MANAQEITRIRYTTDAIIDTLIARPEITQRELCEMFGYKSYASMSIIVNSAAFKHRLAERKAELVDPLISATVEDRLSAGANLAMEKLIERIQTNAPMSNGDLIRLTEVATKGLGMGPVSKAPAIQQNLYVIPAPPVTKTSKEWVEAVDAQVKDAK
jgi:hypothetical protein